MKVYNVLGQEVATLVNGVQESGTKSVRFDAGSLPADIFYRINAGSFSDVKKMVSDQVALNGFTRESLENIP